MAQKRFYVDAISYIKKIKMAIAETGGEFVDVNSSDDIEIYHFGKLRSTLVYDGFRAIYIAGATDVHVKKTKSKLEEISRVDLIEIK